MGASENGQVIVGFTRDMSAERPLIWTQLDGSRDLFEVIAAQGASGMEGWRSNIAVSVSADGRKILGVGINLQGLPEPWLVEVDAVVPLGPAWIYVLTGIGFLGGHMQFRRVSL